MENIPLVKLALSSGNIARVRRPLRRDASSRHVVAQVNLCSAVAGVALDVIYILVAVGVSNAVVAFAPVLAGNQHSFANGDASKGGGNGEG